MTVLNIARSDQHEPPLFEFRNLKKNFYITNGIIAASKLVAAVEDVSFSLKKGETLGIVGESGCGKSTTARLLMQLTTMDGGEIFYRGEKLDKNYSRKQLSKRMQMVFQDSYASLNPRLTIEDSIAFGPKVHGTSTAKAHYLARELLERVGLSPDIFAHRYPRDISGGQRQRVNIARALAMKPELLILDESVSALDKSVEAQVLNLLADIKQDLDLTYIFISHDLNVVRYICDRVLVMYLGKVVEEGRSDQLFTAPSHPYTQGLLNAMPSGDPKKRLQEAPLTGDPPNPISPPSGCRFHTRCAMCETVCTTTKTTLMPGPAPENHVSCHIFNPDSGHSLAAGEPAALHPIHSHA